MVGFNDISTRVFCPWCDKTWQVQFKKVWSAGQKWSCPNCKSVIQLGAPLRPNLPPVLYVGPERLRRIKLTPLPPPEVIYPGHGENSGWYGGCDRCHFRKGSLDHDPWMDCGFSRPREMQPYSIRSVLAQLCLQEGFPCHYFVRATREDDFGNILWDEGCMKSCSDFDYGSHMHACHVANGWMHGKETCEGWEWIQKLCQSENEIRFLHQYLRLNHDREYPMPIPQTHVEVTEQIRVDFVLFVPITRFQWKWLAVEIDSEKYHRDLGKDARKAEKIANSGYDIHRLSAEKTMLDQVRELYLLVSNVQEGVTGV